VIYLQTNVLQAESEENLCAYVCWDDAAAINLWAARILNSVTSASVLYLLFTSQHSTRQTTARQYITVRRRTLWW